MRFAYPVILPLGLALILVLWWMRRRGRVVSAYRFSSVAGVRSLPAGPKSWLRRAAGALRYGALLSLAIAAARPQAGTAQVKVVGRGIDIVLAVDASGSMKAQDFMPKNRLQVAKDVAQQFISSRPGDRIGIVVFAAQSFTLCPLTLDHSLLLELLRTVDFGMVKDGTAIGTAIANAVNRLRESDAKSKVVVLLTDGRNNAGRIDPITAAELAAALGIRIYTIGAGTVGYVPFPVEDPLLGTIYERRKFDLDEDTLKEIARITGGRYFRATSPEALAEVYETIGQMEKSPIESIQYMSYKELGPGLAGLAGVLLALELLILWALAPTYP